jgi:hypothetical protein
MLPALTPLYCFSFLEQRGNVAAKVWEKNLVIIIGTNYPPVRDFLLLG